MSVAGAVDKKLSIATCPSQLCITDAKPNQVIHGCIEPLLCIAS